MTQPLALLGFASGVASNNVDCGLGPWYLKYHPELFTQLNMDVCWKAMIQTMGAIKGQAALPYVEENINELASAVLPFAWNKEPFCVIGGDHSSAIGTWSAVAYANRSAGDIGLIWIDAHMDSHTDLTSTSNNIHGMPLAHLLGEGIQSLCGIFDSYPKLKPENLCIIGVRSYEEPEAQLLSRLGVKVFFMEEVRARGLQDVFSEAYGRVTRATCGFGLSIDLDAIDPVDAPGVGYREPNGVSGVELINVLQTLLHQKSFLGLEIAEFNPIADQEGKTAQLLVELMHAVYK